jgi:hypothetical protein
MKNELKEIEEMCNRLSAIKHEIQNTAYHLDKIVKELEMKSFQLRGELFEAGLKPVEKDSK